MELKEINKMIQPSNDEERPKAVKCVCINYEDFLSDCEGFVQKRYQDFKCNPKNQLEIKVGSVLERLLQRKHSCQTLFLSD